MANPSKNPLSGSFRDPVPGKAPPGKGEEKKTTAQAKGVATDPKATGTTPPIKPGEEKKPAEQAKGAATDPKATGTTSPTKPGEEKKPAEQIQGAATVPKATGTTPPVKPGEEKKLAEQAQGAETGPKATGTTPPAKPDGEKKPAEQAKGAETGPKAIGTTPPAKPDGEKKPEEQAKGAGTGPKATGTTPPAKPGEEKKPAEQVQGAVTDPKAAGTTPPAKQETKDLRFVKLADIKPLPGTYVKDTPRANYSDMIASIKKSGLEKPIILREDGKGGYQLVDGFHRCEAVKQAGMLEIRADVYDMNLNDASRYRKDHRTHPGLPLPGKLVPLQPEPPAPAEKGSGEPAVLEEEEELPANLKIPLAPAGQTETVTSLKIADIRPFEGHPFYVKDNKDMWDLVDSVKKFGVLEPVMVIPHKDGGYEMVSGHRRMRACQLAGIDSIPVIIRDLDRDEAIISMVDSNLKREEISPMEKARAYQMKTDAMRRKVGRRSNEEVLNGAKPLNADQELAQQVGESVATVQRFKTLNKLTPELQEMVDQKKIPVNTGADIAQMKPEEQKALADAIKREDKVPTGAKVKELKEASKAGTLTPEKIQNTVAPTKREMNPELKVTFSNEELRSYFPDKGTTVGDVKRVVFEALTMRQKALERRAKEAAEKGKPQKKSPSPTR